MGNRYIHFASLCKLPFAVPYYFEHDEIDIWVHELTEAYLYNTLPEHRKIINHSLGRGRGYNSPIHIITSLCCKSGYRGKHMTPDEFVEMIFEVK